MMLSLMTLIMYYSHNSLDSLMIMYNMNKLLSISMQLPDIGLPAYRLY